MRRRAPPIWDWVGLRVRVRVGVRDRVGVRVRVSNLVLGVQVLADEGARARGLRVAAVLDRVLEVGHLVRVATAEWSHGSWSSVSPCSHGSSVPPC